MERIDWDRLWEEDSEINIHESKREFWDSFAPRFRKRIPEGERDPYVEQFYELSGFTEGESIFDMGCGSGTLAIPFALKGHEVWAADFSPEMLKHLMIGAREAGVADRVHPIRLDWNEDWSKRQDIPLCDVAISSRSFMARGLSDGLNKLESAARRRVCVGAWDTPASGYVRELAKAIGYDRPGWGCYVFIMGELMDRDMRPRLSWITNPFLRSSYSSREEAGEKLKRSFRNGLTREQIQALDRLLEARLRRREKDGKPSWELELEEPSTIAHIRWDVE